MTRSDSAAENKERQDFLHRIDELARSGRLSLSRDDVAQLMADPSPETRSLTASKVADTYQSGDLSAPERRIAEDIFALLARDTALAVREALSRSVRHIPDIPHDLATVLARDSDSVAVPLIEASRALSEADLIAIVKYQGVMKQSAVARRDDVTERLSDALVSTGKKPVVETLMANPQAEVAEPTMHKALDLFPENDQVKTPLVHRNLLPASVAERLVDMVSEQLQRHLVEHHKLPEAVAARVMAQTRKDARLDLIGEGGLGDGDAPNIEEVVARLHASGKLKPELFMRAICFGDFRFIEAALSQMSGVALPNTRILMHDAGAMGMRSLFRKASLPDPVQMAIREAYAVAADLAIERPSADRQQYSKLLLERLLTRFDATAAELIEGEITALLDALQKQASPS